MDGQNDNGSLAGLPRPDSFGRFGKYGGKYVPETLMHALKELETAFHALAHDDDFQVLPNFSGIAEPFQFQLLVKLLKFCENYI